MLKSVINSSLEVHGLTEDDVQWVDIPVWTPDIVTDEKTPRSEKWQLMPKALDEWTIPQQPEVEALQKGEVDAIASMAGVETALQNLGVGRILYDLGTHPDWRKRVNTDYPIVHTVSTDFANKHPELVVRWLKVILKASMWAENNPDEVFEIFTKSMSGTGATKASIRQSLQPGFHKRLKPELSEKGIEALEIQKRFLKKHGFLNNDFDIRAWMDESFLNAAIKEVEAGR